MSHFEIIFHCITIFILMFVNQVRWLTSVYNRIADLIERYLGVNVMGKNGENTVVEIKYKALERFTYESIYFSAMHMLFTFIAGAFWIWAIYMFGKRAYHDELMWMVIASVLLGVYVLVLTCKICRMCYSYCDTVDLMIKPTLRGESNRDRTNETRFNFNGIMNTLYDREERIGKLRKFGFIVITIYLTFFIGTVKYYW